MSDDIEKDLYVKHIKAEIEMLKNIVEKLESEDLKDTYLARISAHQSDLDVYLIFKDITQEMKRP